MDKKNLPQILSSEIIHTGPFPLRREDIGYPDGGSGSYEFVDVPRSVAILAMQDGNVILLQEYRHPIRKVIFNGIGGLPKSEDENIRATAQRELREETGYQAGKLEVLNTVYPLASTINLEATLFLATELEKIGEPHRDDSELMEIVEMPFEELLEKVVDGEVKDCFLCTAVLLYDQKRRNGEL